VTWILNGQPGVKTAVAARHFSLLQNSQAGSGVLLNGYPATHHHLVLRKRMCVTTPLHPAYAFMACTGTTYPFNVSGLNALSREKEELRKTTKSFGQDQRSPAEFWKGIIHSVICLTTGPTPLPKRFLHIVGSRVSSFK
jgi:hypothetical protein